MFLDSCYQWVLPSLWFSFPTELWYVYTFAEGCFLVRRLQRSTKTLLECIFNWGNPKGSGNRGEKCDWSSFGLVLISNCIGFVMHLVVSDTDITPTDRWLNVWCMWQTKLETLQEFRSRHRIGWIIQDVQEKFVSRSLTFCLETKMPWCQTPSRKRKLSCLQLEQWALIRIN